MPKSLSVKDILERKVLDKKVLVQEVVEPTPGGISTFCNLRAISVGALLLATILISNGALSQTEYWVTVGSYQDPAGAEIAQRQASEQLAQGFSIRSMTTSHGLYHRVVAGPYPTKKAAKSQVELARDAGFGDAWILSGESGSLFDENAGRPRADVVPEFSTKQRPFLTPQVDTGADVLSEYRTSGEPLDGSTPSSGSTTGRQAEQLAPDVRRQAPDRKPTSDSLVEDPPDGYNLHKLHRDSRARPPPGNVDQLPQQVEVDVHVGAPISLIRYAHSDTHIKIDGKLDEDVWRQAVAQDKFLVIEPDTLAKPRYPTDMRLLYTEKGLYVSFDMVQPKDTLVKWLTVRDDGRANRDHVGITLDTSGEGRYGYFMALALGDNQFDGTLLPERQFSRDWDGAWYGASAITDKGWSAEMFIPWSQTAMPKKAGSRRIGMYVSRKFAAADERWGFPALPESQSKFISALQPLELEDVNPTQQWSLFPFSAVTQDEIDNQTRYKTGAEVFWRPSTNFQLAATVNPDFGNVESDDVIVNLSAFETFFPEKRLFFVEGQEIFNTTPRSDPFRNREPTSIVNTRRIGGRPRAPAEADSLSFSVAELNQPTELQGAIRLNGQIGSIRYGVLGASEDDVKFDLGSVNYHQQGSNYGVARFLYENNTDGSYKALGWITTAVTHPVEDAYVHGLDFHYLSSSAAWKLDGQLLHSDVDDKGDGDGGFVDLVYTQRPGRKYNVGLSYFDRNLDINDLGFLRRNDALNIQLGANISGSDWRPVRNYSLSPFVQYEWNNDKDMTRAGLGLRQRHTLHNLHTVSIATAFFPKRFEDANSFGNGTYRIEERPSFGLGYSTNSSKRLILSFDWNWEAEMLGGSFYGFNGGLTWRPVDRMSLKLDIGYRKRRGWLLHQQDANFTTFNAEQFTPRLSFDYFFSAKQHFRVALQWVGIKAKEKAFYQIPNQPDDLIRVAKPVGPTDDFTISNLNFQARYRWQLGPLSDLFVVYTRSGLQTPNNLAFADLFQDAWDEPIGNQLVVKLRYRLGS